MKTHVLTLIFCLFCSASATAQSDPFAMAERLARAAQQIPATAPAEDRVVAQTAVIQAYEQTLSVMRDRLRQNANALAMLEARQASDAEDLEALLGAIIALERVPDPLMIIHPDRAPAAAAGGHVMARLLPELHADVALLQARQSDLRDRQQEEEVLMRQIADGLNTLRLAQVTLRDAVPQGGEPGAFDPENMRSFEALNTMLGSLSNAALLSEATLRFEAQRGTLPWPAAHAHILPRQDEGREGVTLSVRPAALITSPWAATVVASGPFLDEGLIVVLELAPGYHLALIGLADVLPPVGSAIASGAPVGFVTGDGGAITDFFIETDRVSPSDTDQEIYLELRRAGNPIDPRPWFRNDASAG